MNRMILAGLMTLSLGTGAAVAAPNCTAGPGNALLTQSQINSLLVTSARWACVGTSPTAQWNEQHQGGGVLFDYKMGAGHATDPSTVVGSYVVTGIAGQQSRGTITYNYTGGGSYGYNVYGPTPVGPGTYSFCGVSGGAPNLSVVVSAAHC